MFVSRPEIHLVVVPQIRSVVLDKFLDSEQMTNPFDKHMFSGEIACMIGSKLCYMSYSNGRDLEDHIKNLIVQKHGSTLEHANYGFVFAGVSRSLTHELVRHRHFSFSQLSQRFVADPDKIRFVIPPKYLTNQTMLTKFKEMCTQALENYKEFLAESLKPTKADKEAARSILPAATETKIMVTGNLRAWRAFLEKRCSEGADAEIRRLATAVFGVLQIHAPNVFKDYEHKWLPDDTIVLSTPNASV